MYIRTISLLFRTPETQSRSISVHPQNAMQVYTKFRIHVIIPSCPRISREEASELKLFLFRAILGSFERWSYISRNKACKVRYYHLVDGC